MVVAAAGLVLVGLLAAALFSPGQDEPENETTAKDDEDIKPIKTEKKRKSADPYETEMDLAGVLTRDVSPADSGGTPDDTEDSVEEDDTATTENQQSPEGGIIDYTIKSGDMISKLAVRHGCKSEDIYKVNDGISKENAHKIRVGQVIRIPVNGVGTDETVQSSTTDEGSGVATASGSGDHWPRRVITAEAGDTSLMLAVEYYGSMNYFRKIVDANPSIDWTYKLSGGEEIVLPEVGSAPSSPASGDTVERGSLIPARR